MSNRYPGGFITLDEPTVNSSSAKGVWTLDQQADYQGQGVWPTSTYQISRSLRFNSADSAYLSRTFSAGNRKTWTWSGWVKRSKLTGSFYFFCGNSALSDAGFLGITFEGNDRLEIGGWSTVWRSTTAVYRDVSAWQHIQVSLDTTQATANNRVKVYVNGSEVTSFVTLNNPTQNADLGVNSAGSHYISTYNGSASDYDGYMADINFVDGQALTPSSFGETDETTGVWKPIRYAGTYGTNGFHLDFSDNTSTTTLGYDAAGSNDWTLNNFSVTAGAGNDSLVDSPTRYGDDTGAGGEVRGNYCTLNPLNVTTTNTYTNGNLDVSVAQLTSTRGTMAVASGKWYWEIVPTNSAGYFQIGICTSDNASTLPQNTSTGWFYYSPSGIKQNNGVQTSYGDTYSQDDVIGVALDIDAGKVWWSKNGVWQASGDPASGTNAAYTNVSGAITPAMTTGGAGGTHTFTANFGQRPFAYTAPSGFKALCTTNLPEPTVLQGDDYFNTVLWDGSGASQSIATVGFAPDFVWIKSRSNATNHYLYDIIRGANNQLLTNATLAESTVADRMTAFNSDGFTVGSSSEVNGSSRTYVGWNWKGGGAGSSNTDGTLSSTVSTNTTAGISIVTYTGNGTAGATVGHGLGVAPKMIIAKTRNNLGDWPVYHVSLGNTKNLLLNTTGAESTSSSWWNNTTPSSTVITLGNNSYINGNTYTFVAYCFAEVEGFSKFGSYTGNGSTDGVFVYTGFRPAWLLVKRSDVGDHSALLDAKRDTYNIMGNLLLANDVSAEFYSAQLDFTSNGFKLRTTAGAYNTSSGTYIFAAFAENPFKFALAR
jgi:hypothetical protein